MNQLLHQLAEIIATANDNFFNKYKNTDTLMGLIDKALRQQGMAADAVTIDCPAADKKIVFVIYDNQPDMVEVAFGNKAGDISSSKQYPRAEITDELVIALMEQYFINA